MNGDLLRTLEAPEGCLCPRLIQSSTEGNCIIYYEKGHFCLFSVNGKLLGHVEVEDSIKVRELCMHTHVQRCNRTCTSAPHQCLKSLIKGFLSRGHCVRGEEAGCDFMSVLFCLTCKQQRKRAFWSALLPSDPIALLALEENIPEEWSSLGSSAIKHPPAQYNIFPISQVSSLAVGVTQDSSYCLHFPDPLFPVWPGKC